MNFLDWVKKYSVVIAFLFGVATGILTMYYGFNSRLDTLDFKLDLIKKATDDENKNTQDVFHLFYLKFDELKNNGN